jgi:hypothetical protein
MDATWQSARIFSEEGWMIFSKGLCMGELFDEETTINANDFLFEECLKRLTVEKEVDFRLEIMLSTVPGGPL